LPKYDLCANRE